MDITFGPAVPILRMFDIAKADEFYLGYLGFSIDWDHRFEDGAPLYRQVSRGGLALHLSEHHGDGCPGTFVRVPVHGIEAFHRELAAKNYRFMRPGLERMPWNTLEVHVVDPFGNQIHFCQEVGAEAIAGA